MSSLRGSPIPLFKLKVAEKGRIKDIKEIVARVEGLPTCLNGQLVDMGAGVRGIIMGFDVNDVLVLVLGDSGKLKMGREVSGVSEPFKIPVGKNWLGRIVNMLGTHLDQGGPLVPDAHLPVFRDSPPIVTRAPVDGFLPTGTKIVDSIIPLAKGQRQLIIGDRMTGKTVIALDAVMNQRGRDMVCVYCCVGKSLSALEKIVSVLSENGALSHTVVVVANDSAPVGEQYLVPFAAASVGDYFVNQGRDVLVVFDDLTKHAWAYRQLSLLLDRPPGREAYPGDIFYVQTQLMERAGRFNQEYGGGSMTFLGIAETLQGDLTGYIPSNLASMCDGQIVMSSTMFAEGFRPAIDFTLSLSIIGGRVQPPALRAVSRTLRADYARFIEIMRLSKLQSTMSGESERMVNRGRAIMSVLQQAQYRPVSVAEQTLLLYALHKGVLDRMGDEQRQRFREDVYAYARERHADLTDRLEGGADLTPDLERELDTLLAEFLAGAAKGAG